MFKIKFIHISKEQRDSWHKAYEAEHISYRPFKTMQHKRMFDAGLEVHEYTEDDNFVYRITNHQKYMLAKLKYAI
jgi:hypothetical protein